MQNKWDISTSEKVCAFDLDGILNYYPKTWVDYINATLCTSFKDLNEAKGAIPYSTYKTMKWQYRESGIKAKLEIRAGAKAVMDELQRRGYKILILTSRPFKKHKTLFKQTTSWLDQHQIPYDGIIFGDEKYVEVLTQVPHLRFLVDDHHYYAQSVAQWGYDTFLLNTPYNQAPVLEKVHRIDKLEEILDYEFV